jgi:hypothetical protein
MCKSLQGGNIMKWKQKLLSFALAVALTLTAAFALPLAGAGGDPSGSVEAYAEDTGPDTGDTVCFGNYPQGKSAEQSEGDGRINIGGVWYDVEPIAWRVLDNKDGKLFLLSEKNLDAKPYHVDWESVTWEKSTMRSWLNGYAADKNWGDDDPTPNTSNAGIDYSGANANFIGTAFTEAERESIATTSAVNDDNPDYGTAGGNDTDDKIFLLSL